MKHSVSHSAIRQALTWGCTGLIALMGHALAATWMAQTPVAALPDLPEAHFIELAPAAFAAAPTPTPTPAPTPPVPADPAPEPPQIAAADLPVLQDLPPPDFPQAPPALAPAPPPDAVLLNSARPPQRPERRKAQQQQDMPRKTKAQPPQPEAATEAAAGKRAAKAANGTSQARQAASPRAVANWQGVVQQRVARHMQRARIRGARGNLRATIRVDIAASGAARGQLVSGSGDGRIDEALGRQAMRMPSLPAPPGGRAAVLSVPVTVTLR